MTPETSIIPRHVGIIMDGNGRWAKKRGQPRTSGHREGLETAKRIVAHASDVGISFLSLYAFSTENWRRAEEEVNFLMGLIKTHLRKQYDFYKERGIRVTHSGDLERIPQGVRDEILLAEEDTRSFDGMTVNILVNYGGRDEIVRAASRYLADGGDPHSLDEDALASNLDHPEIPDLDLMIRTGGEIRLSNFLIWQAAYAELFFSDVFWPDWDVDHFDEALKYFEQRQRRFGGIPG
ncbi:MAG: polyprenyl diphosphate synthase [Spirochaetaceae bacterium]|nr:polyprenyl diphosphate synthase [Spirochaetaceae bacterium]